MVAAFPQDRTMLLLCFTLWLGACTFVAALLRDFRSYGAVLCGYTVGIIAVSGIDAPAGRCCATLNRVAAILIGILSVAVVNTLLSRPVAFETLVAALRGIWRTRGLALDTLRAGAAPGDLATSIAPAPQILELRTQAVYAAAETAGGPARREGAVARSPGCSACCPPAARSAPKPAGAGCASHLHARGRGVAGTGGQPARPATGPARGRVLRRARRRAAAHHAMAADGLRVLEDGGRLARAGPAAHPLRRRRRRPQRDPHRDRGGLAVRVLRAGGLARRHRAAGAAGGVHRAARHVAQPVRGRRGDGLVAARARLAAWLVGYVLLPEASGFVPFALAVGLFAFSFALAGRHPALQRFGPGFMLYFTLLLAPSNIETFDLGASATTCWCRSWPSCS